MQLPSMLPHHLTLLKLQGEATHQEIAYNMQIVWRKVSPWAVWQYWRRPGSTGALSQGLHALWSDHQVWGGRALCGTYTCPRPHPFPGPVEFYVSKLLVTQCLQNLACWQNHSKPLHFNARCAAAQRCLTAWLHHWESLCFVSAIAPCHTPQGWLGSINMMNDIKYLHVVGILPMMCIPYWPLWCLSPMHQSWCSKAPCSNACFEATVSPISPSVSTNKLSTHKHHTHFYAQLKNKFSYRRRLLKSHWLRADTYTYACV